MATTVETQGVEDAEATEFTFCIPDCDPDATMSVEAPDGVTLQMKRPATVLAGDQMCMVKDDDGKWGINYVVRASSVAAVDMQGDVVPRSTADVENDMMYHQKVQLQTTKGPIDLQIVPGWAPLGAQRFIQLVTDNYFTEVAVYRAVPKFLVQFGVVKDPERAEKYQSIKDDAPRGVPVSKGSICFSAAGADTRCSTICIFLNDFPQLGKNPWETPIGKVHPDSLKVLESLYTGYGDMPQCGGAGPDPIKLEADGNDYVKQNFPKCDFVNKSIWMD